MTADSLEQGVPRSILLVDDDPGILRATRRSLRGLSARVLEAHDATEALAIIEAEPPAVVVSDYQMPGMDGVALIALIGSRWPQIRCVLHSGQERPSALGRRAHFVSKSSRDALVELLTAMLEPGHR